jgi:hypothetical protein
MSFKNPTPVKVGMSCTIAGHRYRVVGRVVMGVEDGGETYYWNEFNLEDFDGQSVDLVYEETENAKEWRLFTLFDPQSPLSVAEAAGQRVGDSIALDRQMAEVTLVGESRVYHIEGKAPEGVEVGDRARYFNAEYGNETLVVSWTGDEIEFYRGRDLPVPLVATAFGLPANKFGIVPYSRGVQSTPGTWVPKAVSICLAGVIVSIAVSSFLSATSRSGRSVLPVKPKLDPASLAIGDTGKLEGRSLRVDNHAVIEIAEVDFRYDRHEYDLLDNDGNRLLLIQNSKPDTKDWLLCMPFEPEKPLTPSQAGAQCGGTYVLLNGALARVSDLCQVTVGKMDGLPLTGRTTGATFYGFSAQSISNRFLVRWNDKGIEFYRGNRLPPRAVADGFTKKLEK